MVAVLLRLPARKNDAIRAPPARIMTRLKTHEMMFLVRVFIGPADCNTAPRPVHRRAAPAARRAWDQRSAGLSGHSVKCFDALAANAATIAKHAHKKGMTLKEAGLDLGVVDEATFDRVVKPDSMLGR